MSKIQVIPKSIFLDIDFFIINKLSKNNTNLGICIMPDKIEVMSKKKDDMLYKIAVYSG